MAERAAATIPVEIGWHPDSTQAALAFPPPEPLDAAARARLAGLDPVSDASGLGDRLLVIRAPYNVSIRVSPRGVRPVTFYRVDEGPESGGMTEGGFQGLFQRLEPSAQRRADTPVLQVSLNFLMITEEPCDLMLLPPFLADSYRDWPGPMVPGRFPLRSWPRALNCVLEWEERDRDWTIRRGDPLAYLAFAFDDPRKVPVPVEAATTPAFTRHFRQISGVIEYGRGVGPMFAEAERRRPARLLVRKRTGAPDWEV